MTWISVKMKVLFTSLIQAQSIREGKLNTKPYLLFYN
jgi:hypothetical protein